MKPLCGEMKTKMNQTIFPQKENENKTATYAISMSVGLCLNSRQQKKFLVPMADIFTQKTQCK